MGDNRNSCKVFVGKLEEGRPLGRARRRLDDIKMDF
jgi:hypothetical protein